MFLVLGLFLLCAFISYHCGLNHIYLLVDFSFHWNIENNSNLSYTFPWKIDRENKSTLTDQIVNNFHISISLTHTHLFR